MQYKGVKQIKTLYLTWILNFLNVEKDQLGEKGITEFQFFAALFNDHFRNLLKMKRKCIS